MITQHDPNKLIYIQSRETGSFELIEEYAQMMRDGVEFDPASAVQDEAGTVYVYDGFHRGEAAKRAGVELGVLALPGDRARAEWLALSANQKHGLRRTRDDKRRAVRLALLHPAGAALSDREIGRHCGVDHKTVGRVRSELETTGEIPQSDVRKGGDGREINTAGIGGRGPRNPQLEIWEIEGKVKSLLGERETWGEILEAIKARTPEGVRHLEELETAIPGQYRRDVRQACNNVLDQIRHPPAEPVTPISDWVPPPGANRMNAHLDVLAEGAGTTSGNKLPCPNCGDPVSVRLFSATRDSVEFYACDRCSEDWPSLDKYQAAWLCQGCGWDMIEVDGPECPSCGVDKDHVSWLTSVPPGDINFKSHLANANLATLQHVLERTGGPGNKVRTERLIARINKLEREAKKLSVRVAGNLASDPAPAGEFDCPRCSAERVVKLNGEAVCLNCDARWSAAAFREELSGRNDPATANQRRRKLADRVAAVVMRMPADKLDALEKIIVDLENNY